MFGAIATHRVWNHRSPGVDGEVWPHPMHVLWLHGRALPQVRKICPIVSEGQCCPKEKARFRKYDFDTLSPPIHTCGTNCHSNHLLLRDGSFLRRPLGIIELPHQKTMHALKR
jgi:hypothetical protein